MKKIKLIVTAMLALVLTFSTFACGRKGDDGSYDEEGNYRPSASVTPLLFEGWGSDIEEDVFGKLTKQFNDTIGKQNNIHVDYVSIPEGDYETMVTTAMGGNNTPDVVYVGDGSLKKWVDTDYLTQLNDPQDNFMNKSGGYDLSELWPSAIGRYRYNPVTTTSNEDDPLWALPKDIGPTVIFYNKTYMTQLGITIINKTEEEIKTLVGQTIPGTTATYNYRGYDRAQKIFNNKIPMSWEECVQLAQDMQTIRGCDYGYFTEWWFNYGWGVGGDCMEYSYHDMANAANPYYKFTLGDNTPNYIVKDDVPQLNLGADKYDRDKDGDKTEDNIYYAGEIISYNDKQNLTDTQKQSLNVLPSQRDAFTEFCRLSASTTTTVDTVDGHDLKGYGVAMNPSTLTNVDYETFFYGGQVGMYVDGRWAVSTHRRMMRMDWDVCSMPVYREYTDETATAVKVHGIQAGHSGSMGIAIPKYAKFKNAAWLFVKYIAGVEGQIAQSKEGFAIPNQMYLSDREVVKDGYTFDESIFLQPNLKPSNAQVFVDAAHYARPADWCYLKDGEWITPWSTPLNSTVRDGKMTVTAFFDTYSNVTQAKLNTYL